MLDPSQENNKSIQLLFKPVSMSTGASEQVPASPRNMTYAMNPAAPPPVIQTQPTVGKSSKTLQSQVVVLYGVL